MKDAQKGDLTTGPITGNILFFALPLMCGNLLQQMYNIADTWVVGRFLGADALAAVGSSYTLMVFLTSVILGLCMGGGAAVSMDYGSGCADEMRRSIFLSFVLIAAISLLLNVLVYVFIDPILALLRVPTDVVPLMKTYLLIIFAGIAATFLYNYCASVLRAIGNAVVPLLFLAVSAVLNVALDLCFVIVLRLGIGGAAFATVLAQFVSGIGILLYTLLRFPDLRPKKDDCRCSRKAFGRILNLSLMTCLQQSIMNFGILMIQGLVNSFGTVIMAAFAAAVKIDSFAYMPHPPRDAQRMLHLRCVFSGHQPAGRALRKAADVYLHRPVRDCDHCCRCHLSAHRGRLLSRHRHPVSALRLLPRGKQTADVRHPDRRFPRHPRRARLCARAAAYRRRHRHLGCDPHRLGAGRRDWHRILRLSARRAQVGLERVHAAHGVIIPQIIQFSKLFHILFDTTDGRRL